MRVLLLSLLLSLNVFANTYQDRNTSFTISTFGGGNNHFYSCDTVEWEVEALLKKLGATNISVRCTGGIDSWNINFSRPAYVRASFTALSISNDITDFETEGLRIVNLKLKTRPTNCHLLTQAFQGLKDDLPVLSSRTSFCSHSPSNFERQWLSVRLLVKE